MTHSRLNNLLIGLLFLAVALLIVVSYARADDLDWHIAGYVTSSWANDAGYDSPAFGLMAEGSVRYSIIELWGYGDYDWMHKRDADSGYTYGYGTDLRGYVYGPWYLSGACHWAGYRSEFANGAVWSKSGQNYGLGAGFNNYSTDVGLSYFLRENESPNRVEYWQLSFRQRVWECVWLLMNINRQYWDQLSNGAVERWSGWTAAIGVGVRW